MGGTKTEDRRPPVSDTGVVPSAACVDGWAASPGGPRELRPWTAGSGLEGGSRRPLVATPGHHTQTREGRRGAERRSGAGVCALPSCTLPSGGRRSRLSPSAFGGLVGRRWRVNTPGEEWTVLAEAFLNAGINGSRHPGARRSAGRPSRGLRDPRAAALPQPPPQHPWRPAMRPRTPSPGTSGGQVLGVGASPPSEAAVGTGEDPGLSVRPALPQGRA